MDVCLIYKHFYNPGIVIYMHISYIYKRKTKYLTTYFGIFTFSQMISFRESLETETGNT